MFTVYLILYNVLRCKIPFQFSYNSLRSRSLFLLLINSLVFLLSCLSVVYAAFVFHCSLFGSLSIAHVLSLYVSVLFPTELVFALCNRGQLLNIIVYFLLHDLQFHNMEFISYYGFLLHMALFLSIYTVCITLLRLNFISYPLLAYLQQCA